MADCFACGGTGNIREKDGRYTPCPLHVPKPPVGLMPRQLWLEQRTYEIVDAMQRYREANKPIPCKWASELLSICDDLELERDHD